MDLSTLRVKQLKEILASLNADCAGCAEKSDFIQRIKQVHKPAPRGEL